MTFCLVLYYGQNLSLSLSSLQDYGNILFMVGMTWLFALFGFANVLKTSAHHLSPVDTTIAIS